MASCLRVAVSVEKGYSVVEFISSEKLKPKLLGPNPPALMEVRTLSDFSETRIAGAQHILFDAIKRSRHHLPADRPIVLY